MLLDFFNLIEKYNMNIKGVIHIGAHFGQENEIYNKANIQNRVFFEPIKSTFARLKENVGEKYQTFNIALGNENKNVFMFVETANSGQSSSVLKPIKHLEQYPHITFNNKEEVSMKRLDDINLQLDNFNCINIDVQGFEIEVFKGAVKTLEKIDYIFTEVNRDELYENCTQVTDLSNFLKGFGFELVEENWVGGTWGDGLYIKSKI